MLRKLGRALLITICASFFAFAIDDVSVRFRIPDREPLGSVKVNRFLSIPQKGGKFQFVFDGTEAHSCVNSWFPHMGNQPCWYLQRHKTQRIDM